MKGNLEMVSCFTEGLHRSQRQTPLEVVMGWGCEWPLRKQFQFKEPTEPQSGCQGGKTDKRKLEEKPRHKEAQLSSLPAHLPTTPATQNGSSATSNSARFLS